MNLNDQIKKIKLINDIVNFVMFIILISAESIVLHTWIIRDNGLSACSYMLIALIIIGIYKCVKDLISFIKSFNH